MTAAAHRPLSLSLLTLLPRLLWSVNVKSQISSAAAAAADSADRRRRLPPAPLFLLPSFLPSSSCLGRRALIFVIQELKHGEQKSPQSEERRGKMEAASGAAGGRGGLAVTAAFNSG